MRVWLNREPQLGVVVLRQLCGEMRDGSSSFQVLSQRY